MSGHDEGHGHGSTSMRTLVLGAIGVVFGDIGTSPLYTIQECVGGEHGVHPTRDNVLGVISLVLWSVTLVVTVKYLLVVMRAHNRGEGGILALLALLPEKARSRTNLLPTGITLLALAGAALLFGDGIITPAISVLSAIEGLSIATPAAEPAVIPLTVAILVGLFLIQSRGTGTIGIAFGPIMIVWFLTIAALGVWSTSRTPGILEAALPTHGIRFLREHGWHALPLLGSVVLSVTGGEALYADMGHFGRKPIRNAWLGLIYPSLLACYLGQGALLLREPAVKHPFFGMVPSGWAVYALVAIAAPATVIASQALISGVFSLTRQGMQLGYFPRVEVRHTSGQSEGQVYLPFINAVLGVSCIALVLVFQHSSKLAAAFGLAVSGTMAITTILFVAVMRSHFKSPLWLCGVTLVGFLTLDLPFVAANALKFFHGGWLPLALGAIFFAVMVIWRRGRVMLGRFYASRTQKLDEFLLGLTGTSKIMRTPGAAVFLASNANGTPPILMHFVRRVGSLAETVVLVTFETVLEPQVADENRLTVDVLGAGFHRVVARFGFMEAPEMRRVLARAIEKHALPIDLDRATYFVGRETLLATPKGAMGTVSESIFAFLVRNARSAVNHFGVPADQVVEVGLQIDL